MKENVKTNVIQMAQLAMMTAISVVLVAFVRIPLIPAAGFLIYDMADVPILIAALVFGTVPALVVLFLVSTIQAFLFSPDGWVGLVMHFVASGALVVLVGEFYKRRQKMSRCHHWHGTRNHCDDYFNDSNELYFYCKYLRDSRGNNGHAPFGSALFRSIF